ncbi:hypothetical protein ACIA03_04555 [Nocardioides sp. NPDC051685]|uniref:hypothetical protein n=1 Tax=Nocardioides sp. NPDC051685 TaxID=3364334 RepID=UPI0037BB1727
MKLTTIRTAAGTHAVRLDGDQHVDLGCGVGHARAPQEFLWGGESVEITVEGIGTLTNTIVKG